VTATRFGVASGGAETVLATKSLDLMVVFQPFQDVPDLQKDSSSYK
jgi:hypothetical protein